MQTKTTITTALLAALSALATANQGFSWDCANWSLSGFATLYAECTSWDPNNGKVESSLDLNNCIGVDAASNTIIWESGGNLDKWCTSCAWAETETNMQCECINQKTGAKQSSSLDLDTGLVTVKSDGTLTC